MPNSNPSLGMLPKYRLSRGVPTPPRKCFPRPRLSPAILRILRDNSFWLNKPRANRAMRLHTHKLPLDVTRASSHLGIPMPGHMMTGLCGGACYATPHSQNTRSSAVPEYKLGNRAIRGACYSSSPIFPYFLVFL